MGEDLTLDRFVQDIILPYQDRLFGDKAKYIDFGDIAGRQITDKSEYSSFAILANYGIFPVAKRSEINEGLTIIRQKLADGSLKVHPRCKTLVEGFKGGYRYPPPTTGTPEPLFPLKDGFYEHSQDAFRYLIVNNFSLFTKAQQVEAEKPKDPPLWEHAKNKHLHFGQDDDFGEFF